MTAALLLLTTACGGGDDSSGAGGAGNKEAALEAAEAQADHYAAQDFAGAWDMWTDEAKGAISRDDYVTYGETCDLGGMPLEAEFVRFESDTEGVVRIGLGEFQTTYSVIYEDGEWRWQPTAEALKDYERGLDALLKSEDC